MFNSSAYSQHFQKLSFQNNWRMEVVAELNYNIPKTFAHHRRESKDIEVDLYRFCHP